VQVPTNWVAETQEFRKKTNRLLGTAGPRRAAAIAAMAKDKDKSVAKLSYMDPPIAPKSPAKSGPGKLVIQPPVSLSSATSEELKVIVVFKLLWHLLTRSFLTDDVVTWTLFP
jgi:hypothetical protein